MLTYRLIDDIMYTLDIIEVCMKKTKVDKLGRIVIPISYRKKLNITCDSEIVVECAKGKITITPTVYVCKICEKSIVKDTKLHICNECVRKIKETDL